MASWRGIACEKKQMIKWQKQGSKKLNTFISQIISWKQK